jgi:hypothetical protein
VTAPSPGSPAAKPTVADLGLDPAAQHWQRSGDGPGAIEIAFPPGTGADQWVLMRVAGDPADRVLVFDRHEWECFLDGARSGEFDDASDATTSTSHATAGAAESEPSGP